MIGEIVIVTTYSIRGKVSILVGTAPSGGVVLSINAENGTNTSSTNVTIPAGSSSAYYEINIIPGSGYKVYYNTLNSKYLQRGYYSKLNGTLSNSAKSDAIDVNSGSVSDVKVSLIENKEISGMISLPSGMTAPDKGVQVIVTASNQAHNNSMTVAIPKGESSSSYVL